MRIYYATSLAPLLLAATTGLLSLAQVQTTFSNGWFNLTIIHTNDIHARIDPANEELFNCSEQDIKKGQCYGGAARHKTLINRLRQGKQNTLLLDGGDEVIPMNCCSQKLWARRLVQSTNRINIAFF